MKLFTVLFVLCSAILCVKSQEFSKERVIALANECKESVGGNDADIDAILKLEPVGSKEAKCLFACTLKKLGLMNDAGKVDKDVSINIVKIRAKGDVEQEKLGAQVVEACADIDVNDHCEASEVYRTCIREKSKEINFNLTL